MKKLNFFYESLIFFNFEGYSYYFIVQKKKTKKKLKQKAYIYFFVFKVKKVISLDKKRKLTKISLIYLDITFYLLEKIILPCKLTIVL